MKKRGYDLVIIGGGIVGLMTAYYASEFSRNIVVVEKRAVGNRFAASSGFTRSIRNDYLDPYYACLAGASKLLWQELECESRKTFVVRCGVLNLAKKSVTPSIAETYAYKSYQILSSLGFETRYYGSRKKLRQTFPQFNADIACLDVDAGFTYIPAIFEFLVNNLREKKIEIFEDTEVTQAAQNGNWLISCKNGLRIYTKNVAVSVGAWSLEMLSKIQGAQLLRFPVIPIPQTLDYFSVPEKNKSLYSAQKMPVFAYLDTGIYGHPLYKDTPGLKVAYFDPNGIKLVKDVFTPQPQKNIGSNEDFMREILPGITKIECVEREYNWYDMTPDNDFIIDRLPRLTNIYFAGGFCGTGFKFAPIVGKIMAELVFRKRTVYDTSRFRADRFGSFTNLSVVKSLPMYTKFFAPRNWKYVATGIGALVKPKLLP
ncbi:FAD-dependent oxidoreductase [Candidatus Gottesmanbacteria bacterium]|nr:FAD-dependent oxidoreductase [Candidatus Gottesmanbacteria bacterium]